MGQGCVMAMGSGKSWEVSHTWGCSTLRAALNEPRHQKMNA